MHWAIPLVFALPKITFEPVEPAVRELHVFVDDRPVPVDALFRTFSLSPGTHHVHAEGLAGDESYQLDEDFEVPNDDSVTKVTLHLTAIMRDIGTDPRKCVLDAKTEADLEQCLHPEPPRGGCRSCNVGDAAPNGDWVLVMATMLIRIAGSRASSCGSRRLRDRADGRSRTRAARRPRS